jgi:hypothetical protein
MRAHPEHFGRPNAPGVGGPRVQIWRGWSVFCVPQKGRIKDCGECGQQLDQVQAPFQEKDPNDQRENNAGFEQRRSKRNRGLRKGPYHNGIGGKGCLAANQKNTASFAGNFAQRFWRYNRKIRGH